MLFPLPSLSRLVFAYGTLALLALARPADAAVTAGGVAVIGYDDVSDSFSIVALEDVSAGTTLYFTDNGWDTVGGQFRGASNSDGDGAESIIKLTVSSTLAAGTILSSTINGTGWAWDNANLIGTIDGAVYSDLLLSTTADQIYAFQATDPLNPLWSPSNFVYALNFGDASYPTFQSADNNLNGGVPNGLSETADTAFALDQSYGFHNGAFGLNLSSAAVTSLNAAGGTLEQWLAVIANSANWTSGEPSTASTLNVVAAPEPSRFVLAALGVALAFFRRRR